MNLRNTIDWGKARLGLIRAADETNRLAAEFMAEQARRHCPVDTGFLKSTIQVIKASGSGNYHVIVTAYYAVFIEYGWMHRGGLWIPPNPFMRRALAETQVQYPSIARSVKLSRPGASDVASLGATFAA